MDKTEKRIATGFGAFFILTLLIALAGLGLIGWAVIELVLWVTSK